ncbi:hypothetical protein [Pectobacterium brasiliense]|uniref:hypothetical protein n=1 Tax=Pectobacterium brasiliense TaxID=180957 RepID=UPI002A817B96|nr:hypothetical protein [Pectobacterium brasiliense]MDY4347002.1 hypothetical protein [Pectobacterium brasiliense]
MLDKYVVRTNEEVNRLDAVRAALEIIKAAAPNNSIPNVVEYTKQEVSNLADVIQEAINKK